MSKSAKLSFWQRQRRRGVVAGRRPAAPPPRGGGGGSARRTLTRPPPPPSWRWCRRRPIGAAAGAWRGARRVRAPKRRPRCPPLAVAARTRSRRTTANSSGRPLLTLFPIAGTELEEQNESYLDLIQEIYAALRKFATIPYFRPRILLCVAVRDTRNDKVKGPISHTHIKMPFINHTQKVCQNMLL